MPPDVPANAGQAFATVLVDELVRHGVRHAVVAPGSRSTPVALALEADERVAVHVRIDERSAAYLALGIAKATGQVVPVLCTSGTASSYFLGAVMEADLSRLPLLALTADRPPELHGIGANQTVEQDGMYGAAVRWAPRIEPPRPDPADVGGWRELARAATAQCLGAFGEPPGPVHLNLPLREPLTAVRDPDGFDANGFAAAIAASAEPAAAVQSAPWPPRAIPSEAAARIAAARRGVLVTGGWTVGPVAPVLRLAERAGWPVIAEPHSGARGGPNALRTSDPLLRDPAFAAAHQPDLVVVVGRVGLSRSLLGWLADVPHLVVSPDGGHWDVTRRATGVVTCATSALDDLHVTSSEPGWLAGWRAAAERAGDAIDKVLDQTSRLSEPRVARDVAELVPDGSALVVGSSMPIRDLDLVMRPRESIRVLANRGVSGIDGFVSTVQGVAIGQPDAPTVALCGDLTLLHDANGLIPGRDGRPAVTYVVINNEGGGIFSLLPQASDVDAQSFERLFGTPHGMSLERFAAAYDARYVRVETAPELAAALDPGEVAEAGVRIVEVRTDRADNARLHARLRGA